MKRNDLDHAFDPTPHVFSDRVDAVLHSIKEDEPVKKLTLRTTMVALLYTILFCCIACAVVSMKGQEWYDNNRITSYQDNVPTMQQEIYTHLETEVPKEHSEVSMGLVNVSVQDYAWDPSKNLFTISFAARLIDENTYELHPMMAMDPDGYWASVPDPNVKESRKEHWLTTSKGFGPPDDVMDDPAKTLLLADMGGQNIRIGDSGIPLYTRSFDSFTGDDGAVITVMEIDLKQLDENYPKQCQDALETTQSPENTCLYLGDSGEAVVKLQEALAEQGYYNGDVNGLYGEGLRLAVMEFQRANRLFSDGVAGPVTQGTLFGYYAVPVEGRTNVDTITKDSSNASSYLYRGDSGEAVARLQEALAEQGYYNGDINGLYGEGVRFAVMAFQEAHQLFSDGVAGPDTLSKVYSQEAKKDPESGGTDSEAQRTGIFRAGLEEEYESMKASQEEEIYFSIHANEANAVIEQYTDADGMLSLRLPYQIVPFENGGYGAPVNGVAVFQVKIR